MSDYDALNEVYCVAGDILDDDDGSLSKGTRDLLAHIVDLCAKRILEIEEADE